MHPITIEKYLEQLKEIKRREDIFKAFPYGAADAAYEEAAIEIATLQLRKILELLAFGFVLATGEKAIPPYRSFAKYKNVKEFLAQIQKLNKDYYPQPIIQQKNEKEEMHWNHPTTDKYLTPEDFDILYDHCDRVLEPRRVGALPMSLEQCKTANLRWYNKVVRLLDAHLIHPEGDDVAYLFQMGTVDANPTCTPFKLISENKPLKTSWDKSLNHSDVTPTDHLRRQLEYLRRSCELYDAGHLDEAIRLAVAIRVLIHDTNNSESLLHQMGVKAQVKLITSFGLSEKLPKNFQPTSIFPLFASSDEGGTSVPFPIPTPKILMSVNEWWDETVWMQKSTLTRKNIILNTANKEGGAHVQTAPPEIIQELRQGLSQVSSIKVNGVEVGTPDNYHLILIRQFAHELLNSESLAALAK